MPANGDTYEPPELTRAVKRLEHSMEQFSNKLDQSFVSLNSEIRDVRHRVANIEAWRDLSTYSLEQLRDEVKDQEESQKKVNQDVMDALEPMNTFLAEQAGVDKWKRGFYALAALIVAILGLVGGWVWAG